MSVHELEVKRLADILLYSAVGGRIFLQAREAEEIVATVLNNYHPRVESRTVMPGPGDSSFAPPFTEVGVTVGSRSFRVRGIFSLRMTEAEREGAFKDHQVSKLGRLVAKWMNGEEVPQ